MTFWRLVCWVFGHKPPSRVAIDRLSGGEAFCCLRCEEVVIRVRRVD